MGVHEAEQTTHDRINLARLVRRLQKSITEDVWVNSRQDTWIKAQSTLQLVKHAKKLLKNSEIYELDGSPQYMKRIQEMRNSIERVEIFILDVEKRTAPKPSRPEPLLPHIPIPSPPPQPSPTNALSPSTNLPPPLQETLLPVEEEQPPSLLPTSDLLLSADEPTLSKPAILAHTPSPSPSTSLLLPSSPTPRKGFQNTTALHADLTSQLSQMATQLKRNAQHFSSSLEKDQIIVDETKEKLESNYDVMHKEQVRLKQHRKGSWWTTGLSIGSLLTVALVFVIVLFIIRVT